MLSVKSALPKTRIGIGNPISRAKASENVNRTTGFYSRTSRPLLQAHVQKRHVQQMIKLGKEMTLAFWNGGKQLWTNWGVSRALQARLKAGEKLSRADHRFIRKTTSDLWKLGPLVLINLLPASLVFLGLYIAAVPNALPSTIQIASWVQKSKESSSKAKQEGSKGIIEYVAGLVQSTPETNDYDHVLTASVRTQISSIVAKAVNHQHVTPSEVMKLSKPFETVMDMVEMERPLLTSASHLVGLASFRIIPLPFRIARLSRHYAYLSLDDKMILESQKGIKGLTEAELKEFLDERGLDPELMTPEQRMRCAQDWMEMARDSSIVPSVFMLYAAANLNSGASKPALAGSSSTPAK